MRDIPYTLNAKKVEVPIKKVSRGGAGTKEGDRTGGLIGFALRTLLLSDIERNAGAQVEYKHAEESGMRRRVRSTRRGAKAGGGALSLTGSAAGWLAIEKIETFLGPVKLRFRFTSLLGWSGLEAWRCTTQGRSRT